MTDDVKALINKARNFNATTLAMVEVGVSSEHKLAVLASRCEGAMQRIDRLATALSENSAEFDLNVERLKACEHIAEGEEGWETLRNMCPSTAAVASLRDALSTAESAGYARGVEEAARLADGHATLSKDLRDHYKGAGQADVAHVWECACTQIKALANDVRRLSQEQPK